MATMVNGSRLEFAGYEFGIEDGRDVMLCVSYETAERLSDITGYPMKMRAAYHTEWVECT